MEATRLQASSALLLSPDAYIYKLVPVMAGSVMAAISSDNALRVIDAETHAPAPSSTLQNVHAGVTCLEALGTHQPHCVLTAGRDAAVRAWDLRSGKNTFELKDKNGASHLSLDVGRSNHLLAAGTEVTHSQATVTIWDYRSTKDSFREYVESHNDDVSNLQFHPQTPSCLLSGSTDGLVNIYDTTIPDEDDALLQITNHGSSIHHAGFLTDTDFYALSHDEILSVYPLTSQDDEIPADEDHFPTKFGDLRAALSCEYIVDIIPSGKGDAIIGAGIHSGQSSLSLIPLRRLGSKWCISSDQAVRLEGAHGSQIVRSMCFPNASQTVIFTGGEDGVVRSWRTQLDDEVEMQAQREEPMRNRKTSKTMEGDPKGRKRFKPY